MSMRNYRDNYQADLNEILHEADFLLDEYQDDEATPGDLTDEQWDENDDEDAKLYEMLSEATEGMSLDEKENFYGEFWGALAAAIPAIASAAPSVIKGVSNLVRQRRKPNKPQPRTSASSQPSRTSRRPASPSGLQVINRKLDAILNILRQNR